MHIIDFIIQWKKILKIQQIPFLPNISWIIAVVL